MSDPEPPAPPELPLSWDDFMALDDDEYRFDIERATIEAGRTLSAEALEVAMGLVTLFVGTRIARRWDRADEAPSGVCIVIRVEAR